MFWNNIIQANLCSQIHAVSKHIFSAWAKIWLNNLPVKLYNFLYITFIKAYSLQNILNICAINISINISNNINRSDDGSEEFNFEGEQEGGIKSLEKLGVDLTAKAEQGKLDPVIGRHDEIDRVIQILSRRTKNNPVLIGEAGVGKSAIVEGLAAAIIKGDCPEMLKGKRIFSLDISSLLAVFSQVLDLFQCIYDIRQ